MKFLLTRCPGKARGAQKPYAFWASRAFPGPQVNKNFIFSKSKPLNENRIDRFLIYVPLDPPLAWFGLITHMKKAYWI